MDFRELYDENFAFVWRALRRLGVPESDLADVLQEVFVVVHRKLSQFEGRSQVTTWLFRIALRAARDRRNRAHVRREIPSQDATNGLVAHHPDPEDQLQRGRNLQLLDRALQALSLDQRAVFVLYELEEMSSAEIAETLCIPLGTVHSRLRLARSGFRKAVRREVARRQPLACQLPETST